MKLDLNKVQIATPCTAKWEQMKGDNRMRHCGECQLNVFNVAGMPKAEAEALIARSLKGERVCMRLTQRADGTILTQDCPEGLRLLRKARVKMAAAMASLFTLCFGLASLSRPSRGDEPATRMGDIAVELGEIVAKPLPPPPPPEEEHLMGKVAYPQPKTPPKTTRPQK